MCKQECNKKCNQNCNRQREKSEQTSEADQDPYQLINLSTQLPISECPGISLTI